MTDIKAFLFGINNAGKTALCESIKLEKTVKDTRATVRIMISQTLIKNMNFYIWDLPGQSGLRDRWIKALEESKVLLFVLDTADKERYNDAKTEFFSILNNPESSGMPLIFCYHKMDLPDAKNNLREAQTAFDLEYIKDRQVIPLETSINSLMTVEELKEKMVSIFL